MLPKTIGDRLQSTHSCRRCGSCCRLGGNILLAPDDLTRIAGFLQCDVTDRSFIPVEPSDRVPGAYRFIYTCPCFYQDKLDGSCTIYSARPAACREYPFALFSSCGCSLEAVLLCPSARTSLCFLLRSTDQ